MNELKVAIGFKLSQWTGGKMEKSFLQRAVRCRVAIAQQLRRRTWKMFEQTPHDTRRSTHDVEERDDSKLVTFMFKKCWMTCDAQHQLKGAQKEQVEK